MLFKHRFLFGTLSAITLSLSLFVYFTNREFFLKFFYPEKEDSHSKSSNSPAELSSDPQSRDQSSNDEELKNNETENIVINSIRSNLRTSGLGNQAPPMVLFSLIVELRKSDVTIWQENNLESKLRDFLLGELRSMSVEDLSSSEGKDAFRNKISQFLRGQLNSKENIRVYYSDFFLKP